MSNQGIVRWLVVGVAVLAGAGCGASSPAAPSPVGSASSGTVRVVVQGRLTDTDRATPIAGATVALATVAVGSSFRAFAAESATTGANGEFELAAELPPTWSELSVKASAAGYEVALERYATTVSSTNATVDLTLARSVTLSPGQAVELRLDTTNICGFDDLPCRRVVVAADGGRAVEVELTPLGEQHLVGLMTTSNFFVVQGYQTRVTTSTGEVWIVGEPGPVRLTAR